MSSIVLFTGEKKIAEGTLPEVAVAARRALSDAPADSFLAFDAETSSVVELDLRGSESEVRERFSDGAEPERGPGRPRLGVIAREVTLLPRHWDWLSAQPGGASAALRRLVEEARRDGADAEGLRRGKESLYRFAAAMAGNAPGFEDAMRALFADQADRFRAAIAGWPTDVKAHALALAPAAFDPRE